MSGSAAVADIVTGRPVSAALGTSTSESVGGLVSKIRTSKACVICVPGPGSTSAYRYQVTAALPWASASRPSSGPSKESLVPGCVPGTPMTSIALLVPSGRIRVVSTLLRGRFQVRHTACAVPSPPKATRGR